MTLTVAKAVRELEKLKHRRAVWMETVEHLHRFIDKESKRADHGIVAEGCVVATVPQEVVREFIDRINEEEIEPLNVQIGALENLFVEEGEEDGPEQGDQKSKPRPKKKKGTLKKRGSQGGGKKDGPQGRVRAVPRAAGQKAQGTS